MDRKWWIAEELFYRYKYNIQTLTNNTFRMLLKTEGKKYKLANDPCNYEMLMDDQDVAKLKYASLVENDDPEQSELSD